MVPRQLSFSHSRLFLLKNFMAKHFKEVDPRQNFPKLEEDILKNWEEKKIFKKSVEQNKDNETFVFFEGPPTANGKPGIHHVLARAFKDVIPRYKTMKGYYVPRKAGWDTHGLPVELQVEKELGISGKPEIEKYGVEEFNKKCKESVWQYKDEWERLTTRIAFWLDLEKPYITYDNDYIESLWSIIKKFNEKGLLYEGYKVVPYCPRCGTALSSHEVAQGYADVTEPSVFVKFKVKGEENTYILSWTTTPWTLPGNVGLAVGSDIDYVKIKVGNEFFVLAESRLEIIDEEYEVIEKYKGKELENIEYEPLFDSLQDVEEKGWYVMTADFVTTDSGTGVVHTAVMYGEDDYNLGIEKNLPQTHTVDLEGKFNDRVKEFKGLFVKDAEKAVADNLKERGLLYKKENYTHSYPHCWRCDTPLLYYAKSSWFIKMSSLRDKLIENNKEINWVPEHIKEGRFGMWLENVKDWALSRDRYWGTPLPIWRSENGEVKVIGSREELKKLATQDLDIENLDLHKPYVDEIILKAEDGSEMKRDKAVMDVWFDSGAMPFAQHHYPFENKELIDSGKQFPADYISEAIDQTRGWFYTLLAISTALGMTAPYKNVICLGHINDKHGKKMSKSRGNVVNPWEVIDQYGVDALRWYLFTMNAPGEPKRFDPEGVEGVVKNIILKIWNVYSFFTTYANIDEFSPEKEITPKSHILDRWMLSRTEEVKETVNTSLENYDINTACNTIESFINDISNWYVRRSRRRFWKSENDTDKFEAYQTLHYTLLELTKMIAPFMPFVSDAVYQGLGGEKESVHLDAYPEKNEAFIDARLSSEMRHAQLIVKLGHAARDKKQIKVRQPLSGIQVSETISEKEIIEMIKEELNVKEISKAENLDQIAELKIKLNFPVLGKRLQGKMKAVHQAVEKGNYSEENNELKVLDEVVTSTEYEKIYSSKDEFLEVTGDQGVVVVLNTEITEALKNEGIAREMVRNIQDLRKAADYKVDDRINVAISGDARIADIVNEYKNYIAKEVLAVEIVAKLENPDKKQNVQIEGESVTIEISQ